MIVLLYLNALFNVMTWPALFRRVVRDPRARDAQGKATPFLTVHAGLFAASMVLAVVSVAVAVFAIVDLV
jgi:hypothetical protein